MWSNELSSVLIPEEQNWHYWLMIHLVFIQRENSYFQRQKQTICYIIRALGSFFMVVVVVVVVVGGYLSKNVGHHA